MANSILEKSIENIFSCLSNKNVNEDVKFGVAVMIAKVLIQKEISIENRSSVFENLRKMLKSEDGKKAIENYFGKETLDIPMKLDKIHEKAIQEARKKNPKICSVPVYTSGVVLCIIFHSVKRQIEK